ncbi:hypothetical protein SETIT_7G085900v2 [Setaria italica]|uniref:Bifunctional inhibitor/plant lipid transfer protein/seed storage helical domain-containing protein n=1 Tax=Setaria italica TaxID=4555 RepID=A0A368RTK6_SETIT|nr:hypothetical protein SETIT_7G085900v2 [Setaria italica]
MRPAVFLLVAVVVSLLASRAAADFSALAPVPPTPACCARLKSHGPNCLCRYKDDANLKRLVDTRHKRRVFTACKVPVPSC